MKICKLCNIEYNCSDCGDNICYKECVMNSICQDCYYQHVYLIHNSAILQTKPINPKIYEIFPELKK